MKLTNAKILILAAVCGLAAFMLMGCQMSMKEIKSPQFVMQRGPEVNYNQEGSGVNSRSTGTNQQVAKTAATQKQAGNRFTADMPTAMESTKQVGLKQGQAATTTKTQGDTSPATTTAEQVPTGQQGGDAVSAGAQPIATADNAAANTAGTATNQPAAKTLTGPVTTANCAECGKELNADGTCDSCTLAPSGPAVAPTVPTE